MNKKEYGELGYIDFSKLWIVLQKKGLNKQFLRDNGIHTNTISKLVKNENISCEILAKLCFLLKCDLKDICCYNRPEKTTEKS